MVKFKDDTDSDEDMAPDNYEEEDKGIFLNPLLV